MIHHTAEVHIDTSIGIGTQIWNNAQIRAGATVGSNCIIGKDVYIDSNVNIGDNVKIQNGVSIYQGVTLENGVFCGPNCVFTNDKFPRAINSDNSPRRFEQWKVIPTLVHHGASIGANATIICGVTIGMWSVIGAGSVVTADVQPHEIVVGNPAKHYGYACKCGTSLEKRGVIHFCVKCEISFELKDFQG